MRTFSILFKAEFRRFWTLGMIIFSAGLSILSILPSVISIQSGMGKTFSSIIQSTDGFLSFFTFLIFSAGIVSADVKSGWVRTLLIRSVTREQYVTVKILVVFVSTMIVYFFCITSSTIVIAFDPKVELIYDLSLSSAVMALKTAHVLLLIVLSTLVSCSLLGSFNALVVYAWITLAQGLGFLVTRNYWDVQWAVILKDYLFPSGFEDAQQTIITQNVFPAAELLWGIGALSCFYALTLFSMNRVMIDTGSE